VPFRSCYAAGPVGEAEFSWARVVSDEEESNARKWGREGGLTMLQANQRVGEVTVKRRFEGAAQALAIELDRGEVETSKAARAVRAGS
jgi:hypothetical protein